MATFQRRFFYYFLIFTIAQITPIACDRWRVPIINLEFAIPYFYWQFLPSPNSGFIFD